MGSALDGEPTPDGEALGDQPALLRGSRGLLFHPAAKLPYDQLGEDRQFRSQQIRAAEPVLGFGEGGMILDENRPGRLDEPRGLGVAAESRIGLRRPETQAARRRTTSPPFA